MSISKVTFRCDDGKNHKLNDRLVPDVLRHENWKNIVVLKSGKYWNDNSQLASRQWRKAFNEVAATQLANCPFKTDYCKLRIFRIRHKSWHKAKEHEYRAQVFRVLSFFNGFKCRFRLLFVKLFCILQQNRFQMRTKNHDDNSRTKNVLNLKVIHWSILFNHANQV